MLSWCRLSNSYKQNKLATLFHRSICLVVPSSFEQRIIYLLVNLERCCSPSRWLLAVVPSFSLSQNPPPLAWLRSRPFPAPVLCSCRLSAVAWWPGSCTVECAYWACEALSTVQRRRQRKTREKMIYTENPRNAMRTKCNVRARHVFCLVTLSWVWYFHKRKKKKCNSFDE